MCTALAELCLLGNKTHHSQVGDVLTTDVAVWFDSKLRKLKLQTYQCISPAKVREKPPDNIPNRKLGCEGREISHHHVYLMRMLCKRESGPH